MKLSSSSLLPTSIEEFSRESSYVFPVSIRTRVTQKELRLRLWKPIKIIKFASGSPRFLAGTRDSLDISKHAHYDAWHDVDGGAVYIFQLPNKKDRKPAQMFYHSASQVALEYDLSRPDQFLTTPKDALPADAFFMEQEGSLLEFYNNWKVCVENAGKEGFDPPPTNQQIEQWLEGLRKAYEDAKDRNKLRPAQVQHLLSKCQGYANALRKMKKNRGVKE